MKRVSVDARRDAARLWGIAALVAALDVGVALELKPETAMHFAAVLGLCAAMAIWSGMTLRRDVR